MTRAIREEVAQRIQEIAGELANDAAFIEERVESGQTGFTQADLDGALAKRVRAAYFERAATLLEADKKGVVIS